MQEHHFLGRSHYCNLFGVKQIAMCVKIVATYYCAFQKEKQMNNTIFSQSASNINFRASKLVFKTWKHSSAQILTLYIWTYPETQKVVPSLKITLSRNCSSLSIPFIIVAAKSYLLGLSSVGILWNNWSCPVKHRCVLQALWTVVFDSPNSQTHL